VRTLVVILSGHSLFAEGVASRLKKHLDRLDLQVVDIDAQDVISKIVGLNPATVILDATDAESNSVVPLSELLKALPGVSIICLDPQQSQVQVVTSEERILGEVKDLIEVIQRKN
jgi:DNA-binding NarL/FixJ family response regulator